MDDDPGKKSVRSKRLKKIGLVAAIVFTIYLIVGFWIAPPLLKPRLEAEISNLLGRKVTIDGVKLNPLVLSTTISRLTVHEADGQPFAGFDALYANAQLSSIFRWALVVREIRVENPFATLKLFPGDRLNVDDILARLSAPAPEPAEEKGLPRAVIEKFQVVDGKLAFENRAENEPIREEMAPVSFTVENLSTLAGRRGEYRFVGVGAKGARFEIGGHVSIDPVRVQGHYAITGIALSHYWTHIKDIVSFQITGGTAATSGDYTVELVDGRFNATLENGTFALDDFKLVEKGRDDVLIALPTVAVKGIRADLPAREITVATIQTADARIKSWLAADGTFALRNLLLPDLAKLAAQPAAGEREPQPAPARPWQVTLDNVAVTNWAVTFEDRTLAHPAEMSVDGIHVAVENLSTKKETQASVRVAMRINRTGTVDLAGTAGIAPLQADMKVTAGKIALSSFQPYVDEAVKAKVAGGTVGSAGRIRYHGGDATPQISFTGELHVDDLAVQDPERAENFITQKRFAADGIVLELRPNRLNVANVFIDRPHARVTIDKAGVVNVVKAFAPVEEKTAEGEENLLQRLVNFLILQFKGPMPMQVDQVRQEHFTADFVDASVTPTFTSHLEFTKGTLRGLSSDPSTRAKFRLNGTLNRTAAIAIAGQVNPMNALKYGRLDVSLEDFALPAVSPYSGKFIGFVIDKGTLDTTLKYTVDNDKVNGSNVIIIDQLTLGRKVDSPDALALPIKLGVALLKDKNGRIAVQAPVIGNIKDPRFDLTQTLISALTGTVKDAGSAPFATISAIDGFKGEELRTLAFEFGSSVLEEREMLKLNALAKFLKQRTSLILGIAGIADRHMDGAALLAALPQKSPPEEKPADEDKAAEKPAAVEVVDDARLEALAQSRADRVSAYLIEKTGIEARRIQLEPIRIRSDADDNGGLVEFSLTVD